MPYKYLETELENKGYNITSFLPSIKTYLKQNYGLDIKIISNNVNYSEEVGNWEKGILTINGEKRGILGTFFMVAHVFGHLIQYTHFYEKYKDFIHIVNQRPLPLNLSLDFKKDYFKFEKEAFEIGKSLLGELIKLNKNIETAYYAFMITDYEHFFSYLITGKIEDMESFNKKWVKKYIQLLEDINLEDNYIMENFNLKNLKLNKKFISDVSIKIV